MKHILIIGAGKSSSALIKYLLDKSEEERLQLTVADISTDNAKKLINNHRNATAIVLDVFDKNQREDQIKKSRYSNLYVASKVSFTSSQRLYFIWQTYGNCLLYFRRNESFRC
jgi:saccharopine dehydrogenase-like NADP-dependent oxidoreductase